MITPILRRYCRRAAVTSAAAKQTNNGSCRYSSDAQQLASGRQFHQSPLLTNNNELSAIVNSFPTDGVDYAFGYGSGVLKQQQPFSDESHSTKSGMVDIILAVDDTYSWHKHNLQSNKNHYSGFARIGGSSFVYWMQNLGARLYFHPFVTVELDLSLSNDIKHQRTTTQREIKYGVISTDDMIEDLTQWKYLYLAGRMHKPTVEIENRKHEIIAEAQHQNLLAAVSASILLHGGVDDDNGSLPTTQLYNTIAGISYTGDIRMQTGAEDPNKVKKLVETPGMLGLWDNMYSTIFEDLQRLGILSKNNTKLDLDFNDVGMRRELMKKMPQRLHSDKIVGISNNRDSILQGNELLKNELRRIVAPAAKSQSIKGLFSAGVSKSFNYAMAKFAKGRLKS